MDLVIKNLDYNNNKEEKQGGLFSLHDIWEPTEDRIDTDLLRLSFWMNQTFTRFFGDQL